MSSVYLFLVFFSDCLPSVTTLTLTEDMIDIIPDYKKYLNKDSLRLTLYFTDDNTSQVPKFTSKGQPAFLEGLSLVSETVCSWESSLIILLI